MRCFRFTANRSLPLLLAILALLQVAFFTIRADGQSSASVQVKVCDPQGRPIPGATVHLQSHHQPPSRLGHTDAQGQYRFTALGPGTYTVRAQMAGSGEARFGPFTLQAGTAKDVTLTLALAASRGSSRALEFFDEPQFTVAGVTDITNLGGHASNASAPAKQELARQIVALGGKSATASSGPSPSATQQSAEAHHSLGEMAEKRGDPLQAAQEYEQAARLDPSETNLFDWGAELLLHGAAEPAGQVFSRGNRLFPHSVRMLLGLGVASFAHGSVEQAARYFSQAADLDPENPQPYLFLGQILQFQAAPLPGVTEKLARYARLRPQDAQANYYYSLSLWNEHQRSGEGGLKEIESLLQKAVQLDSRFAPASLQLGILYAEEKQYPEAVSAYQKAIAADPRQPDAHYRLAQAYMRAGDQSKARAEMRMYDQLSRENAQQAERERQHMQQFVYTLRGTPPPPR
jgi:tetratricopeptide (TPR) repeat protein